MQHLTKSAKTVLVFLILLGHQMSASGNHAGKVPAWFSHFVGSFTEMHRDYLEACSRNQSIRNSLGFEPVVVDPDPAGIFSIPLNGLDAFFFNLESRDGRLGSGDLLDPVLVDGEGKRFPLEFSRTGNNLQMGNIYYRTGEGGKPLWRLRSALYRVDSCSGFERFEVRHVNGNTRFKVDPASDHLADQDLAFQWQVRNQEITDKFPEAGEKHGYGLEMLSNISGIKPDERASLQVLAQFYVELCRKDLLPDGIRSEKRITLQDLYQLRQVFVKTRQMDDAIKRAESQSVEPVIMAITDCRNQFGQAYAKGEDYLKLVEDFVQRKEDLITGLKSGDPGALDEAERYFNAFDEALLANPLLDFDKIVLLKRDVSDSRRRMPKQFGFPSLNSHVNTKINEIEGKWGNSICILTGLREGIEMEHCFTAEPGMLITDLEMDFQREHLLFSMEKEKSNWHVYERDMETGELACVTPDSMPDVNHFDACYLPDGNIIYTSDASYQGLPCEGGSRPMALLYLLERETGKIRQLTYEQDSDFCPVVLNNGRLMYLRWEYSDLPHYFSRILMSCNPDGTAQMEYYGSNSYFPNSFMYARPIPGHPSRVVGIVGGHHGISRSGRLMILDPVLGRSEADGVVHEIPHRGRKVEPLIKDRLVEGVWPQFLHPYPLNDKYFLVSAKPDENSLWGIYLVDVFDNMTLISEIEGSGLFDPIPLREEPVPPVIPSRIKEGSREANVFISDIYIGDGLKDIPKGTVKSLRLFSYHYGYISTGGHQSVGVESSWDIKRILGTVPVEEDGSAMFKVPANTPISIQPLDSAGRALQIMRSWFVGMPGENVSCIGCHERTSQVPPNMYTMASRRASSEISPWQGIPRPFTYRYEVQPLLEKYCVSCHHDTDHGIPDFSRTEYIDVNTTRDREYFFRDTAYMALHPFVRRPGPESDIHMFRPMEYHSGTSELIQMLQRGHHGVEIEDDDWEVLYTWIDLNAPHRGKWSPPDYREFNQDERRKFLNKEYANIHIDPEAEYDSLVLHLEHKAVVPKEVPKRTARDFDAPLLADWPLNEVLEARGKDGAGLQPASFDIGDGQSIRFVPIPAGKFISGNTEGYPDEQDPRLVEIGKSFLMSECEITNAQYALFDPSHDSRFVDQQWKDHTTPGYPANLENQPVIRVSYEEAVEFCKWLSMKLNRSVSLPTDMLWEWACRAGSTTAFWYGSSSTDFSKYENLADDEIKKFAVTGVNPMYIGEDNPKFEQYAFIPRIEHVNDGHMIAAPVGSYAPNHWGLYDMHGNVAEWTASDYSLTGQVQDQFYEKQMKVVKGGSWRDRPKRSHAGSKRYYQPYQKVYNVGFRVVIY